jgi:ribosomal protein S13
MGVSQPRCCQYIAVAVASAGTTHDISVAMYIGEQLRHGLVHFTNLLRELRTSQGFRSRCGVAVRSQRCKTSSI